MALSRNTKFTLANVALLPVGFLVYRYYVSIATNAHNVLKVFIMAAALYTAIAVIVVVREYYRKSSRDTFGQTATKSDALAFGALGSSRLRKTTLKLEVQAEEIAQVAYTGSLKLALARFNTPIRPGDTVELAHTLGNSIQRETTTIDHINGVRQEVVLIRKNP